MEVGSQESILFIGDSITDCGRARPVGCNEGLGDGYVSLVNSFSRAGYPERGILMLNTAISGNRVIDLEQRWQTDVLDLDPDWLSVMVGINDVWRQFDSPLDPEQVLIGRYEETYRRILDQARPMLKGLVLMAPYYLESNRSDPMRACMDEYGLAVKRLATEFDAVFVDIQAAFDRYLSHCPTQTLCSDRVHPNQIGHVIIAKAFLTALNFNWKVAGR